VYASNFISPIASSDRDQTQFGIYESTLDGNLNFLGDFNTESYMSSLISDGNNCLESGSLTSLGLFLDGYDLHDFIRELYLCSGE